MKKVISSTELRNKMNEAIDLLCDTVKTTLGPKCNNIIIDHSAFTPFITNDGVTIANNIESDDEVINTILSLAKESSINTNDLVGDGTTTTLVLLQSIYKNGIKELEGISPIILKDELFETLTTITQMIKDLSFPSSKDKIFSIAKTSSNSTEIGKIIRDAYIEVNNKNLIKITESPNEKTNIIYKNGYIIDSLLSSPYFLKDKNSINIKNPLILIINNYLDNIDDIANILNEIIKTKTPLIILAEDYSDTFTNEIINLNMQDITNIYLLKFPLYGFEKIITIEDIALITNSTITDITNIKLNNLGKIDNVTINNNEVIFNFKENDKIKKKINEIKKLENTDFNIKRFNMLTSKSIEIQVGGLSTIEKREKKMRFDDALCAVNSTNNGILLGSGISLYQVSENLNENNIANKILKIALKTPFEQIMLNAGLDKNKIINEIKKSNYKKVYNVLTDKYENIDNTNVIDTYDVVINSLKNAISVASMLLTTTSLVINEYQNNINDLKEYGNI